MPKGWALGECGTSFPFGWKKIGAPWTFDGGTGYTIVKQYQYRSYLYGGYLIKRKFNKKLGLAAEVLSHGREGFAAPQTQSSTLIDAGGYYHFKYPGLQFLFAYGHSVRWADGELCLPWPLLDMGER